MNGSQPRAEDVNSLVTLTINSHTHTHTSGTSDADTSKLDLDVPESGIIPFTLSLPAGSTRCSLQVWHQLSATYNCDTV